MKKKACAAILVISLVIHLTLMRQISFGQTGTSVPAADPYSMAAYVNKAGVDICLIWNTQTGKSAYYYWDGNANNWTKYMYNLPGDPLEKILVGRIMMVPYYDNTGVDVCMVWDTKTGRSMGYYWDNNATNWKKYMYNLPDNPLDSIRGEIMMSPYFDDHGREVCLMWDTKSARSVYYYFNYDSKVWTRFIVNLPQNPLPE